jgi:co-chaperonin GroES (HSP10)
MTNSRFDDAALLSGLSMSRDPRERAVTFVNAPRARFSPRNGYAVARRIDWADSRIEQARKHGLLLNVSFDDLRRSHTLVEVLDSDATFGEVDAKGRYRVSSLRKGDVAIVKRFSGHDLRFNDDDFDVLLVADEDVVAVRS